MMSFWFNGETFIDGLSCLLVVRKKYTNINGKDSKYTNAIDINIFGSCGRRRCRGVELSVEKRVEGVNLSVEEEVEDVELSREEEVEGVELSLEEEVDN